VKGIRDDFTHSRRALLELHGGAAVSHAADSSVRAPIDADSHQALALAFYAEVLAPAIRHAGRVLSSASPPRNGLAE
jgi:hypothetical protein